MIRASRNETKATRVERNLALSNDDRGLQWRFDPQLWPMAIGCIVFGVLLIGVAVFIAATVGDWRTIKELRAKRSEPG